ncbi:MAG: serine hydrolase [Pseudomonadota bacterium]
MTDQPIMRGFPPPDAQQVTLANWRQAPFSRWSFRKLRQILPTEALPPAPHPRALPEAPRGLDHLRVGNGQSLSEVLIATHTTAFLVLHRGAVAFEWYGQRMSGEQPHVIFSVTKSVTGALTGIMAEKGLLDPEGPVSAVLPEVAGSTYAEASIRHLLDMTVGSCFVEDYANPTEEYLRYREATGWNPSRQSLPAGLPVDQQSFLTEPLDMRRFLISMAPGGPPHGSAFHYVSPNSDLLGWVLERASGKSFAQLLAEEIWQPMGATGEAYIAVDRLGAPRTAGGLTVTARDLARFGELMRRRGCLEGRQIIPGRWVDDIRFAGDRAAWQAGEFAAFLPEGHYRSQWYKLGDPSGCFFGLGIHGQWLFIDPLAESVIVKFSADPEASNEANDKVLLQVFAQISAALTP